MKNMVQDQEDEVRKGPWTEQEDFQLNCFVGLFGDRRWDFIAKVSGLNRTGKSCRLRWVNYLHPGLKRGKMTPQEERLVLELHSKWGNRWSRIARKLPGRTDNEIKNYWRTHMRKKAQEEKKKQAISPSSPLSSSSSKSISSSSNVTTEVHNSVLPHKETGVQSFYDTGGVQEILISKENNNNNNNKVIDKKQEGENGYFMDDIWKEITLPEVNNIIEPIMVYDDQECCNFSNCHVMSSPTWDYYSDSLWEIDDEKDSKMIFPTSISDQQFLSFYEYEKDLTLTG